MEHYVAYHSVQTMGRELELSEDLYFFSRKLGLLRKAVGNVVWLIQGLRANNLSTYTLLGVYVATALEEVEGEVGLAAITGEAIAVFDPPVTLNEFSWFDNLKKSQSNFSLGFNRINDVATVEGLLGLLEYDIEEIEDVGQQALESVEGRLSLVAHIRVERDKALVSAKKQSVLASEGKLACQACGFDFFAAYGSLGYGLCEVHHLEPLAAHGERVTALTDLAIVCANCHRVIHRTDPLISIADLSELVAGHR